ncbi:hypothetical protein EPO34_04155, partial [Patescibacteria group bacterium]
MRPRPVQGSLKKPNTIYPGEARSVMLLRTVSFLFVAAMAASCSLTTTPSAAVAETDIPAEGEGEGEGEVPTPCASDDDCATDVAPLCDVTTGACIAGEVPAEGEGEGEDECGPGVSCGNDLLFCHQEATGERLCKPLPDRCLDDRDCTDASKPSCDVTNAVCVADPATGGDEGEGEGEPPVVHHDNDNDGFSDLVDCDDEDATVHPGAGAIQAGIEVCGDGIDQDCSGSDAACAPNNPPSGGAADADNDGYSTANGT